jgi:hypothetical protein
MKNSLIVFALLIIGLSAPTKKKVFICTDPKSQIYHLEEICKDLEKCKFEVKEVKENEAKDQEKILCKLCKQNETKEDNKVNKTP